MVGTSILNLWVFFIYLGLLFLTKEMMRSRFFNTWGAHQLNAGLWDMPWQWAYYAVYTGWDSFSSLRFYQDVDPSFQHTWHPTVKRLRDALHFTTIFFIFNGECRVGFYENWLCCLTISTGFCQGHIVHTWIRKLHLPSIKSLLHLQTVRYTPACLRSNCLTLVWKCCCQCYVYVQ